jgi:hypothetical protein
MSYLRFVFSNIIKYGVFLAWTLILLQIGKTPRLGTYVEVLVKVSFLLKYETFFRLIKVEILLKYFSGLEKFCSLHSHLHLTSHSFCSFL